MLAAAAGLLLTSANGQGFSACGPNVCASSGASVGIGTNSPEAPLDVGTTNRILLYPDYGGHGELPAGALVGLNTSENGLSLLPAIDNTVGSRIVIGYFSAAAEDWFSALEVANTSAASGNLILMKSAGNVGIGTTDPCTNSQAPSNCKLSVAGAIQAQEVVVNSGWSDYVFSPDYRLQPLAEVAYYIAQNQHLPDIPSAAEVKEKGVDLGKMQTKLLAKIEELTLHMIDEEKQNNRLEQQNRELQERVARLEALEKQAQSAAK